MKNKKIIEEANRIEEDAIYSSKSHFNTAQFWDSIYQKLGIASAVLSAVAGASALAKFDYHEYLAGAISILVVVLTSVMTFVEPNKKASTHHDAGNKYNSLKNRARIFREIEIPSATDLKTLISNLKSLNSERDELNAQTPQPREDAFKKARQGIEEGEASYKVDKNKK